MAALANDLGLDRVALVANKIRDPRDLEAVRQFADRHELELAGVIPFDPAFQGAERAELAPLDFAPDAPAIGALDELARTWGGDGRA